MLHRSSLLRCSGNTMNKKLKIIECPRDAIQGLPFIETASKVAYLKKLLACGFHTLDCVSFVPPKAVPQMADSETVLNEIAPFRASQNTQTQLLAVVANLRGAQQAIAAPEVNVVGYPLSASETFQKRNTNRSIAEALHDIAKIQKAVAEGNNEKRKQNQQQQQQQLGVCISMAFGNPYGETVGSAEVRALCEKLHYDLKIPIIYFADTVGSGDAQYIANTFREATADIIRDSSSSSSSSSPPVEFGVHLHSHPALAAEKLRACIEAGCRRFDGATCGLGGCPFAQDNLVGNIPSETIVRVAEEMGFEHGIDKERHAEARELLMELVPHLKERK